MKNFNKKLQEQFNKMQATGILFKSVITGRQVWDTYIMSFNKEDDPVFRDPASTTHSCNLCNNFIKRYGNIVAFDVNNNLMSLFDFEMDDEFKNVAAELSKLMHTGPIKEVFIETYKELVSLPYEKCVEDADTYQLGLVKNVKRYTKEEAELYGVVKANEIRTFNHLNIQINRKFISFSGKSAKSLISIHNDNKKVFKRALDDINLDTFQLVKDLIVQGSLLDGATHLSKVEAMIKYAKEYKKISSSKQDTWAWKTSHNLNIAKFKNELIGKLCSELAEGEEINKACKSWNKRVDPANYMKAVAPITKKQIADAQQFVEENGYVESFDRRLATATDIKVSEILHINAGDGVIKKLSMFDDVKPTKRSIHKRNEFDNVEEVSIDTFMKDILPSCSSVEVLLKNNHEHNMVNLTTAATEDSKPIFKWPNNYSWTFNGNLAGKSQLAEAVKGAGGRVDGVLRFSNTWNNEGYRNQSLMDFHVFMPGYNIKSGAIHNTYPTSRRVGWNHRVDSISKGSQDVDYVNAAPVGHVPIENITFPNMETLPDGTYLFRAHNWSFRITGNGFRSEIAFGDEVYNYEYNNKLENHEWVTVAKVHKENGAFEIEHVLTPTEGVTKEIYGLETNTFHKVNLMCLSPNYWDDRAVGNKHYFFMLEKCMSPVSLRSFHNENLIPELADHRKVLDVLGNTKIVESTKDQLAGLGFNATVRDELIVKLSGNFKRMLKIKF